MVAWVREIIATRPGFLDGRVLESDDGTRIIVVTQWETRHAWAQAEWNDAFGKMVVELHQSAERVDTLTAYERAAIAPRPR